MVYLLVSWVLNISTQNIQFKLIDHVELVDDADLNKTQRKKFWHTMDIGSRALIYNKCKEIVRIDEDLEVDLFPDVG